MFNYRMIVKVEMEKEKKRLELKDRVKKEGRDNENFLSLLYVFYHKIYK